MNKYAHTGLKDRLREYNPHDLKYSTVAARIRKGCTLEKALNTPANPVYKIFTKEELENYLNIDKNILNKNNFYITNKNLYKN